MTCRPFRKLSSGCTKNKCTMGYMMPSGLPGEADQSFARYAPWQIRSLAKVFFRCRTIVFAICDILLRASSPE